MQRIELTIRQGCVATIHATKSVLGKDVEARRIYLLAPSSAKFVVDASTFSFSGTIAPRNVNIDTYSLKSNIMSEIT